MIWPTDGISLYLFVIAAILPFACGTSNDCTYYVDDTLMLIAMSCATLLEAASYVVEEIKNQRRF